MDGASTFQGTATIEAGTLEGHGTLPNVVLAGVLGAALWFLWRHGERQEFVLFAVFFSAALYLMLLMFYNRTLYKKAGLPEPRHLVAGLLGRGGELVGDVFPIMVGNLYVSALDDNVHS